VKSSERSSSKDGSGSNEFDDEEAAELGDEEASSPAPSMALDDSDGSKGNAP
jgi:hypothetical protein